MMYDFFCNGYGLTGGMGFMWLFWLLLFGAIIGLAVWAVTRLSRPASPSVSSAAPGGSGALAILKERYARGEITREEFESMRQDILD